jgi:hypothetical protein
LSLTSGTLWHLIHLPSPLWACLDEKVEDGRCVARGLRRWGEWGTNGSNESERSSDDDDDDDTVGALRGKRHFEETCAFGHRVNSRCASTDRVVSTQPVSERCLVVAGSHPSTATLSKCLHGTVATWDQSRRRVRQLLRRDTKGTRTHKNGAGRARSPSVLRHEGRPSPGVTLRT